MEILTSILIGFVGATVISILVKADRLLDKKLKDQKNKKGVK